MPDYQQGKIYKITAGNLVYIGSTTEPALARRLAGHVGSYKQWEKGRARHVTSFQLIETGQYDITLIEAFPCNSKDELTARERFYIESTICVNKIVPGRTPQEWIEANPDANKKYSKTFRDSHKQAIRDLKIIHYKANSEAIKEKKKAYYEANAEVIIEKQKAYYQNNKEKIKAYYEENAEAILEKQKTYYQNNAESIKTKTKVRRMNKVTESI